MKRTPLLHIGAIAVTAVLVALPFYFVSPLLARAFVIEPAPIRTIATRSECGNGVIEPSEVCDDGNALIVDGCVGCMVEKKYRCKGEPSVCLRRY